MSKTTALIIVSCLILFITIRINIALNYQGSSQQINNFEPQLPTVYTGTLPCESCPEIDYELRLEQGQFTEFNHDIDSDSIFSRTGKWEIAGDTLTINTDNPENLKRFVISETHLKLLYMDEKEIAGELANNYRIHKNTEFQSILNHHTTLRRDGVKFTGSGNEPFWAIHLLEGDTLRFMKPISDDKSLSLTINKPDSGTEYLAEFSSGHQIKVFQRRQFCRDSMSGFIFTHTISVTEFGVTRYGCGRYL